MARTLKNCRIIRRGLWLGVGKPKVENGMCEGYCTNESDETSELCRQCRLLKEDADNV